MATLSDSVKCGMSRAILGICAVGMICTLAHAGDCEIPESTTIEIQSRMLCVYGHWFEGQVTIIVTDGQILVEGIRIFPALSPPTVPDAPELESESKGQSTKAILSNVYQLQEQLWEDGFSKRNIQAQAVAYLERNDEILSVNKASVGGDFFDIVGRDGYSTTAALGVVIPELSTKGEQSARCRGLIDAYTGLSDRMRRGWLQIYSSDMQLLIGPSRRNDLEVVNALENAICGKGAIDSVSWDSSIIPLAVAQELRNPRQIGNDQVGGTR